MNKDEAINAIARIAIRLNETIFSLLAREQSEKTYGILQGLKLASQTIQTEYKHLMQTDSTETNQEETKPWKIL